MSMSGRILDPSREFSPLVVTSTASSSTSALNRESMKDFWDQYFELQDVVEQVSLTDGSFSLRVTNHQTGETVSVSNVRFSVDVGQH